MSAAHGTLTLFLLFSLLAPDLARAAPPADLATPSVRVRRAHRARRQHRRRHHRRHHRRRRLQLVQFASGPGFTVLRPERAWGQPLVVWRLNEVLCAYHVAFPAAAPVLIQDLSKRHGGRLKPHVSHRRGWDVDIGVVRRDRSFDRFVAASARTLHVRKTWWLINKLISSGDVEYIFLNRRLIRPLYRHARRQGISRERLRELFHYPRRSRWGLGIIRAEPGHRAHFHVRFQRKRPSVPEPVI